MKINETILTLLTDTDTLLESVYREISRTDPQYSQEEDAFRQGVQALLEDLPEAEKYLRARQQELASDIRFAMWQGFVWGLDCIRDPINKLLAQLDFEELCQEGRMHALPAAQAARAVVREFVQSLPVDRRLLLDPIIDHFAYLETYGYKLAHAAGFEMANKLQLACGAGL